MTRPRDPPAGNAAPAPAPLPPTLSIIGPGRVGGALGRLLHEAGAARITDVLARSADSAAAGVDFIGAGRPVSDFAALQPVDMVMLSVADDALPDCVEALAATACLQPDTLVWHCSGALPSAILAPAAARGALLASVHPIRSFADPVRVSADFAGTCCGIEGDGAALPLLHALFNAIGARLIPIDAAQKTLYHAAAVFASNYTVTLIDVAMQAYGRAGVNPEAALAMIAPLLRESAENAFRLGPAAALTGPIARGDMQTVACQQQALALWSPAHAALYAELAHATVRLAASRADSLSNPDTASPSAADAG